jgi:uncharacterized protein (DUF4415 family)
MQKSEHNVSYTADELRAMRKRGEDRTDWEAAKSLSYEEIEASIDFDEEGTFELESATTGSSPVKERLTIRFDEDVIAWFKDQGPGSQSRMNDVLRGHMEAMKGAGK